MTDTLDLDVYRRLPTEAAMEQAIREAVTLRGGRLWHLVDARTAPELADLPDLIVVCPPLAGLLELKSQRRSLTPGQREVAHLLRSCTRVVGGVVRPEPLPEEWSYDDIIEMLKRC